MKTLIPCLVLILGCCPTHTAKDTQEVTPGWVVNSTPADSRSKVLRTLTALSDFNLPEAMAAIEAAQSDEEKSRQLGAVFVKQAYERQEHGLDTTECRMIWKAILVSCKTKQDGFELMDIQTPWLGQ